MKNSQICIFDEMISKTTQMTLLDVAKTIYNSGDFSHAKIGKGLNKKEIKEIRGDLICWLDDWSSFPLSEVKEVLEQILVFARRGMYLPLKRFESHFSFYPVGRGYLKHVDRHKNNPSRWLSAVLYLAELSDEGGGELVVYSHDKTVPPMIVKPQPRRLVVFDSYLEHEVNVTKVDRWSLTSWFRDDVHPMISI
ncbi:MAG: 2OG-Fe(II) oxygenase [Bdellovibrionaceae bacterium]|nr:2OG-Fe(II) oxygenase [Pseudobdellovibrionaceae bacterium]